MKRFNWKKILSLVLVLTLVVGTITWNGRAANAEGEQHPTKVETTTKDGIKITKELKNLTVLTGKDAGFAEADIVLTVDGANATITQQTAAETAIVFVMDLSNSMDDDNQGNETGVSVEKQRITAARAAAKSFAAGVLTEENKNAVTIGIASFGSIGHTDLSLTNDLKAVTDALDGLVVGAEEKEIKRNGKHSIGVGGTNLQGGIHEAAAMLAGSKAANKIIVILSDGQPTYSYKAGAVSSETTTLNDGSTIRVLSSFTYDKDHQLGGGSDYSYSYKKSNTSYNDSYTISATYKDTGWYKEGSTSRAYDTSNNKYFYTTYECTEKVSNPYDGMIAYYKRYNNSTPTAYIYHVKGTDYKVSNNGVPAISEAINSKAVIYSIAYDVAGNTNANYVMKNIASSASKFYAATSGKETETESAIDQVLEDISTEVNKTIAAARGTSLVDELPSYMTAVSVSGTDAKDANIPKIGVYGNDVDWSLAALAAGVKKTITIKVKINLNTMAAAYAAAHPDEYKSAAEVKAALANGTDIWFDMNKQVTLSYTDKDDKPVEDNSIGVVEGKVNVPQGQIPAYNFTINYVDEDGKQIADPATGSRYLGEEVIVSDCDEYSLDTTLYVHDADYVPEITVKDNKATVDADRKLAMPEGDVVITVKYAFKLYAIEFLDDVNGNKIAINGKVTNYYRHGATVTQPAKNPTKGSTYQYEYTFSGWSPAVAAVTQDQTYTAQYTRQNRTYTIRFVKEDGITDIIDSQTRTWGEAITAPTAAQIPEKAPSNDTVYTFSGWERVGGGQYNPVCDGDATYKVKYSTQDRLYLITFKNQEVVDGKLTYPVYGTQNRMWHEMPTAPEKNPTRAEDEKFTYSFTGWTPVFAQVESDQTYTACYEPVYKNYEVKFIVNGTEYDKADYHYGDPVTNKPDEATLDYTDNEYDYTFNGWKINGEGNIVTPDTSVTRSVTYVADFSSAKVDYYVIFKNGNSSLATYKLNWNDTVVYSGETPTQKSNETFTFTFSGWTPVAPNATAYSKNGVSVNDITFTQTTEYDHVAVYNAAFTEEYIEYEIAFVDDDSTPIYVNGNAVNTYHFNDPVTVPADPAQKITTDTVYTFSGWSPSVTRVTKSQTYMATYSSSVREYTVTFYQYDGETVISQKSYPYGTDADKIAVPALSEITIRPDTNQYEYSFDGWDKDIANVTGDAEYTAVMDQKEKEYIVKFINGYDVIQSDTYTWTETVFYNGSKPVKESTNSKKFIFNGWSPAFDNKTGAAVSSLSFTTDNDGKKVAVFEAQFTEETIYYTVTFVFNNGTADFTDRYEYEQDVPVPDSANIKKDPLKNDRGYDIETYKFDHWYKIVNNEQVTVIPSTKATENITYYAAYEATPCTYKVTFTVNKPDGKQDVTEKNYKINETVTVPNVAGTVEYNGIVYEITDWDKTVETSCQGPASYVCGYIIQPSYKYTVTFYQENKNATGEDDKYVVLSSKQYTYNQELDVPDGPVKDATKKVIYTFEKWDKAFPLNDDNKPVCRGHQDYYPVYSEEDVIYTVKFVDEDGNAIIVNGKEVNEYTYKQAITEAERPLKEEDNYNKYDFAYWTGVRVVDNTPVSYSAICYESVVYSPVYTPVARQYFVTFEDLEDDDPEDQVSKLSYGYGATFTVPASTLRIKKQSEMYDYTFIGWAVKSENEAATYSAASVVLKPLEDGNDPEDLKVTGDVTYVAVYEPSLRVFNVEFLNDDETTLGNGFKSDVIYGNKVTEENYDAATNAAEGVAILRAHEDKEYFFAGWEIKNEDGVKVPVSAADYVITADTTFYASYVLKQDYMIFYHGADPSKYGAENEEKDYMFTKASVKEGSDYTLITYGPSLAETNTTKFEFIGWRTEYVAPYVFPDATQLDIREARVNVVTISRLAAPTFTTKYVKNELDCVVEIKTVANKVDLYPVYNSIEKKFTVTFKDADGTVLATRDDFIYNEDATTLKPANPQGWTSVSGYTTTTYTFKGWDVSDDVLKAVQKDMVVTAQYDVKSETNIPFNIITPTPSPSPTPSPTPTVTPTPVEDEIIETPETPQGPVEEPEEEIIPPQPETPQGAPEEEVDLDDIETPQGDLPKTGTTPTVVFFGLGAACIMLGGVMLKGIRRREDEM